MRMWMVDPTIMCRKHLLGEHVELHMLATHLRLGRRIDGYVRNNCVQPQSIAERHFALATEMKRRGYNHVSPLLQPQILDFQFPLAKVNIESSLTDLQNRCQECSKFNA